MANQRPDPEPRLQAALQIPLVRPEKTTPPPSPLIPARAVVVRTARGARGGCEPRALHAPRTRASPWSRRSFPVGAESRAELSRGRSPPRFWPLWLRVSVARPRAADSGLRSRLRSPPFLRPALSRVCAASSPGGAGPLRSGARNLAHALARLRPVPCTRPVPPHGAHTYVRGPRPRSSPRAPGAILSAPPLRSAAPRGLPCREPNNPACETAPRGGLLSPQLPHPAAQRTQPAHPKPWAATTHPAFPSWLSVARGSPPFFGSSSVYIDIIIWWVKSEALCAP